MDNSDIGKQVKLKQQPEWMTVKSVNGNQITVEWLDEAKITHDDTYLDSLLVIHTTEQEIAAKRNLSANAAQALNL